MSLLPLRGISPFLLVALLFTAAGNLLGADPLATADNTAYELCASCAPPQLRVLVNAKAPLDLSQRPEVAQVLSSGQRDDGLQKLFRANWQPNSKGGARAIEIRLDPAQVLPAGTYDLYLDLQPASDPSAPRLKITLTNPAPKLFVYPKVLVNRIRWLPFFDGASWNEGSRQVLDETSRRSPADNLKIRLASLATSGANIASGSLTFPNLPSKIMPGQHIDDLTYQVSGPFPLGVTTGTMKVFAAESSDALASFDFEVRDRVARGYLWLILLLGLATSWVVKVKLQQNIEFDQAYLDASALVERVEAEGAKHDNPAFTKGYEAQLGALQKSMQGRSVADINQDKLALDAAWKAALADLAKARQPAVEAYEQLDETLRLISRLDLPDEILQVASAARTDLLAAKDELDRDAFGQVSDVRNAAIEKAGGSISSFSKDWAPKLRLSIEALTATNGLSATLAKQATEQAVTVLAALQKLAQMQVIVTTDQLKQAASDVSTARSIARQYLLDVANNNSVELVAAQGQIRRANLTNWKPDPFRGVEAQTAALSDALEQLLDKPDANSVATALDALHTAWSDALKAQLSPVPTDLVTLLDSTKYLDALALTLSQLRKQTDEENPLRRTDLVFLHSSIPRNFTFDEPATAAVEPSFSWRRFIPRSDLTVLRIDSNRATERPPVFPSEIEHHLWRNKLWQTLGAGVIAALGGYGLFSSSWVGSFADFSTAFFWAFGLDLTLDAVLKVLKKS